MSYYDPTATEIATTGFDAAITSIQQALKSSCTWIDKVFHRAYIFRDKDENGKVMVLPKVWEAGNEWINVLPNDNMKSQSFFTANEPEQVTDYDTNDLVILATRRVSLILWMNTSDAPSTLTGPSLADIKKRLLTVLMASDRVLEVESIIDQDAESVFEGFTINDADTKYLMLPYAGLRINFTLKYQYSLC